MGGNTTSNKYAVMLAQTLRVMAVVIAFATIAYTLAASLGIISRSQLYTPMGSLIVCSLVVVFAAWVYVKPLKTNSSRLVYFIIPFHALGMALPLLISGFLSPMTMFWLVLIVVTGTFFGKKAMVFSGMVLMTTALLALAYTVNHMSGEQLVTTASDYLGYALMIITLSWFVGTLRAMQADEHADYIKSEQRRTDDLSRLMTLINSLNEAIISINAKGVIQLYNAATLSLLDTNQNLTGKKLDDVINLTDDKGDMIELFEQLNAGAPSVMRDDIRHSFEDSEVINLAVSSSRVRDNHNATLGYIIVLRDITREKSLSEERDEFISVVSHELRTPITITEGTISNVQLLIKKGATPKVVSDALDAAHEQTLYLARMINDLSTLSRAERNVGSETERINVQQFAHEIYKDYESKAAQKGLKFNLDIAGNPGYVKVSRLYLEEVLQNFLTNAIKYTPSGSVDFLVRAQKGQVNFAVKDSGIGITKKEHEKIFQKFYRSEDYRTRETSGTGLGLYIVQKLANKLGTKVELESRLNHGSTFSVSIPLTVSLDSEARKA